MTRVEALLQSLLDSPSSALPEPERCFTMLVGFAEGFHGAMIAGDGIDADAFDPPGFSAFVLAQTRPDLADGSTHWSEVLRAINRSEADALAQYFTLRFQFLSPHDGRRMRKEGEEDGSGDRLQSRRPQLEEFLEAIRDRPGMYFGNRENWFTMMLGFIRGFKTGKEIGDGVDALAFRPPGFSEFVIQRTGVDVRPSAGWEKAVRAATRSEGEALSLYLTLRLEYLREHEQKC